MIKKFYISDLHIGHKNVIKLDNRPFGSVQEMNEEIVRRWNSVVKKGDLVYLCGDVIWDNSYVDVLKSLRGQKHLVLGNHDRINAEIRKCFFSIKPYKKIKDGDETVILSHYPMIAYDGSFRGRNIHLYGHVHTTNENVIMEDIKDKYATEDFPMRMYNVGCMMPYMDYTPRTLDEILLAMEAPKVLKSEDF